MTFSDDSPGGTCASFAEKRHFGVDSYVTFWKTAILLCAFLITLFGVKAWCGILWPSYIVAWGVGFAVASAQIPLLAGLLTAGMPPLRARDILPHAFLVVVLMVVALRAFSVLSYPYGIDANYYLPLGAAELQCATSHDPNSFFPFSMFSFLPPATQTFTAFFFMLFGWAYYPVAQWLVVGSLLFLCVPVARRLRIDSAYLLLAASVFGFQTNFFGMIGSVFHDPINGLIAALFVLLYLTWTERPQTSRWTSLALATLGALAIQCKLTNLLFIAPVLMGHCAVSFAQGNRSLSKRIFWMGAAVVVVWQVFMAPYYYISWKNTGNPYFLLLVTKQPFFHSIYELDSLQKQYGGMWGVPLKWMPVWPVLLAFQHFAPTPWRLANISTRVASYEDLLSYLWLPAIYGILIVTLFIGPKRVRLVSGLLFLSLIAYGELGYARFMQAFFYLSLIPAAWLAQRMASLSLLAKDRDADRRSVQAGVFGALICFLQFVPWHYPYTFESHGFPWANSSSEMREDNLGMMDAALESSAKSALESGLPTYFEGTFTSNAFMKLGMRVVSVDSRLRDGMLEYALAHPWGPFNDYWAFPVLPLSGGNDSGGFLFRGGSSKNTLIDSFMQRESAEVGVCAFDGSDTPIFRYRLSQFLLFVRPSELLGASLPWQSLGAVTFGNAAASTATGEIAEVFKNTTLLLDATQPSSSITLLAPPAVSEGEFMRFDLQVTCDGPVTCCFDLAKGPKPSEDVNVRVEKTITSGDNTVSYACRKYPLFAPLITWKSGKPVTLQIHSATISKLAPQASQ